MRESALLSLYKLLYKLLIQAADTLSLILQNICELSYPLSPAQQAPNGKKMKKENCANVKRRQKE